MIIKDETGRTIKEGNMVHMLLKGMSVMRVVHVNDGSIIGGEPPHIVVQLTMGIQPDKTGRVPVYIVDKSLMDKVIEEVQ